MDCKIAPNAREKGKALASGGRKLYNDTGHGKQPRKEVASMDIQKIINEIIAKLQGDNGLLKDFALNPAELVKKIAGIDLNDEQVKQIIEAVKGKIDLSKIDVKEATGLLGKIKSFFGK